MNRYMYILCLFFTFTLGVLHNLLQQLKIACIVCRMSFARNDCPTTFWHWMHFPETWYPKWQTNYSDGLWTSCAQTSFMDIYHHQIGKSLFLGSRTEYFAESSRDEYSILPLQLKTWFSSRYSFSCFTNVGTWRHLPIVIADSSWWNVCFCMSLIHTNVALLISSKWMYDSTLQCHLRLWLSFLVDLHLWMKRKT